MIFKPFFTSFPLNILSLSLTSIASFNPVEAPDGLIALPDEPFSVKISTSIVGLPLESKTLLDFISFIRDLFIIKYI